MAVHFLLETSGPADIENILPSLLLLIFKRFWNALFLILDVRTVFARCCYKKLVVLMSLAYHYETKLKNRIFKNVSVSGIDVIILCL